MNRDTRYFDCKTDEEQEEGPPLQAVSEKQDWLQRFGILSKAVELPSMLPDLSQGHNVEGMDRLYCGIIGDALTHHGLRAVLCHGVQIALIQMRHEQGIGQVAAKIEHQDGD